MAVVSAKLQFFDRGGERESSGHRNFQAQYDVVTDNDDDGPLTVLSSALLPQPGDTLNLGNDVDPFAFVVLQRAQQTDEDKLAWKVVIQWSSVPVDIPSIPGEENVLAKATSFNYRSNRFTKFVSKDLNNLLVRSSAREPYEPFEVDDGKGVIVISKNKASGSIDSYTLTDYENAVNSDFFIGFAPNLLKMSSLRADEARFGDTLYYVVTAEVEVNQDGWNPTKILDQGYYELKIINGILEKVAIKVKDEDGNLVKPSAPVLLDGAGLKLGNNAVEVYREYTFYKTRPFSFLGIVP